MTWKEIINLLAILLGPIFAIQVSQIIEKYKRKRERQEYIFKVLMATRGTPLDTRHVEALNMIDVEFYENNKKAQEVLRAWKDYLDHLNLRENATEFWVSKGQDLFVELIHKMAICLGYKFEKTDIRKTSYFPQGLGKIQDLQNNILECLGEIFNGNKGFPITNFPEIDNDLKEKTLNIVNGLDEIVSGKRSIAVSNESKK
jgi:hypothetical protein